MAKFRKGDKVKIPTIKSTSSPTLKNCSAIRSLPEGQDFLYVVYINNNEVTIGITRTRPQNIFLESDLELYIDEPNYEIY